MGEEVLDLEGISGLEAAADAAKEALLLTRCTRLMRECLVDLLGAPADDQELRRAGQWWSRVARRARRAPDFDSQTVSALWGLGMLEAIRDLHKSQLKVVAYRLTDLGRRIAELAKREASRG